jgi:hypothetical protein
MRAHAGARIVRRTFIAARFRSFQRHSPLIPGEWSRFKSERDKSDNNRRNTMSLPTLTPQQRAEALQKAILIRRERGVVRENLKLGSLTIAEVIKDGKTSDITGKMKVTSLLEAMPGVGKVRAKQIMERLSIAESRRVRGLGANQREALERLFDAA